jgi:hypothetical protein
MAGESTIPDATLQDLPHISNMTTCAEIGHMRVGQAWSVRAEYDFSLHAELVLEDGTREAVEGWAVLYVRQNEDDDDKLVS